MKKRSIFCIAAAAFSVVSNIAVFAASTGQNDKLKSTNGSAAASKHVSLAALQKQVNILQNQIANMKQHQTEIDTKQASFIKKQNENNQIQSAGLSGSAWTNLYAYGPAITTTPIIGTPNYSGFDLYVNNGSVNEDMGLMKLRQDVYNSYVKNGIAPPERPVIALSGSIEGQAWNKSHDYSANSASDIDLTTVAIEAVANINEWVTGMFRLTYNDNQPNNHDPRTSSGNIYVDRAYLTAGNTDKFPLFVSIGEMKVPFSFEYSYILGNTATHNLAKMVERPLVLGFVTHGFYGKFYGFKGETHEGSSSNVINNYGTMLGYKGQIGNFEKLIVDVGAGAIKNLADALGLQGTNNPKDGEFKGFGQGGTTQRLYSTVPAVSLHAIAHYDNIIDFVAEYTGAINSFDSRDMTFNNSGAKPQAMDLEIFYNFKICGKPSSLGVTFDRTWQALAANLPQYSFFVTATTSLFKRTVQSIEWEHDINYSSRNFATGSGIPITTNAHYRTNDLITGSFKIFF